MTETKQTSTTKTDRRPDCVTEIRISAFARIKKSVTKQAWQFLSLSLLICSMPTAKRQ